jgi:hypothetical protein
VRSALVALILSACGGGTTDPHSMADCDQGWIQNGLTQCEAACVPSGTALGAMGAACSAHTAQAKPVSCSKTFVFEGVTGCCSVEDITVHFAECDP